MRLSRYFAWKRPIDALLAVALLIPGLPMIVLLVLVVRLTSRGPGIYRQRRCGKEGEAFFLYKIRTMVHDAEANTGPVWTKTRDPRVTAVGRLLRKLHLDEIPQLINVLKGEMSLVGPRPERPEFVEVLSQEIPRYTGRLAVLPGVTGMAQLNLPADTDLLSAHRKLMLDLEYIEEASLFLDFRLLLCTFARIFKIPAVGLLGLGRQVTLPPAAAIARVNSSDGAYVGPLDVAIIVKTPHSSPNGNGDAVDLRKTNSRSPKPK